LIFSEVGKTWTRHMKERVKVKRFKKSGSDTGDHNEERRKG
jgi:hypothetical protein